VRIAEELQKLEELRRSGSLTEEGFAKAKARALAASATFSTGEQAMQQLSAQLAEALCEKELARLDLEWEIERQKHFVRDRRRGKPKLPATRDGINFIAAGVFCALIAAIPFAFSPVGCPPFWMFGIFAVYFVGSGIYRYAKAKKYEKALAVYQSQRWALRAEQYEGFPQIKAALQASSAPPPGQEVGQQLSDQLAEVRYQTELARLDREWEIERQTHFITIGRTGRIHVLPTYGSGIAYAVFGAVLGLVMTIMGNPSYLPFIGLVFAVLGIASGIYQCLRAKAYQKALADYESRRIAIQPEQERG